MAQGKCYNCGEEGHFAKGCRKGGRKTIVCFRCKKEGHISRFCPEKSGETRKEITCFACGKRGHIASQCPDRREAKSVTQGEVEERESQRSKEIVAHAGGEQQYEEL